MTDLETILSWFQTGDMPTEEEFRQAFSSFRHKNTKIPIEEVDRLESLLNSKINSDDYIKDGKIRADKVEALGLTELIEASEKDISEFAENSDKYEFQQNDFIAIPNEDDNFSLYLFKGGEKRNKSNYLSMAGTNMSSGVDFIPLSGTEPGKPLTLPIEYVQGGYTDAAIYGGTLTGGRIGALSFGSDNDVRLSNGYTQGAGTSGMNIVQLNTENIQISSETMTGTDRSEILIYPGVISTYAQNINLVGSNVTIGGLPNAQGDLTFTRQIVQKEDGSIGYEPKSKSYEAILTDLSRIENVTTSQDDTNLYIRGKVTHVSKYSKSNTSIGSLDVYLGSSAQWGTGITTATDGEFKTGSLDVYVGDEKITAYYITNSFIVTIPKDTNEVDRFINGSVVLKILYVGSNPKDISCPLYFLKSDFNGAVLENISGTKINRVAATSSNVQISNETENHLNSKVTIGEQGINLQSDLSVLEGYPRYTSIDLGYGFTVSSSLTLGQENYDCISSVGEDRNIVQIYSFSDIDNNLVASLNKRTSLNFTTKGVEEVYSFRKGTLQSYTDSRMIFAFDKVQMTNISNAEGDPSFNRQLVQKQDGTIGYEKRTESAGLVNSPSTFNSNAELNASYPNAVRGSEVYFDGSEVLYKKVTSTKWAIIPVKLL